MRRVWTVMLLTVLLALSLPASATVADLEPPTDLETPGDPSIVDPGPPGVPEGRGCLTDQSADGVLDPGELESAQQHLPLYRWGDSAAGSLHSRLSDERFADLDAKISRDMIVSTGLSMGNGLWDLTARMVEFAIHFDLLCHVGAELDQTAAGLGEALMGDAGAGAGISTVVFVVTMALLVFMWRVAVKRGAPGWSALLRIVIILALFAVMLNGAANSRTVEDEPDYLGAWSPAWIAVTINEMVATVASVPATAIAFDDSVDVADWNSTGAWDCNFEVDRMRTNYRSAFDPERDGSGAVSTAQGAIPLVLSSMWEETGLRTWIAVQFGADNEFGEAVFCRLLDRDEGLEASPTDTSWLNRSSANYVDDMAMVFWAACEFDGSSWTARESWTQLPDPAPHAEVDDNVEWMLQRDQPHDPEPETEPVDTRRLTGDDCDFIGAEYDYGDTAVQHAYETLDWDGGESHVRSYADGQDDVRDYMLHLHGHDYGPGVVAAIVYVFASLAMLVVFGLISIGVIMAKVLAAIMVLMAFILLLVAMLGNSGWDRATKALKGYLGITLFVFGLTFLLALVTLITGFVNSAGTTLLGDNIHLRMVWLGFSPLVAIFVLHIFFTKILSLPSPFTPTGAMSYAGVVGGAGAAAGAGLNSMMSRVGGGARNYGQKLRGKTPGGRKSSSTASSKDNAKGREGRMDPEKSGHGQQVAREQQQYATEGADNPQAPHTPARKDRHGRMDPANAGPAAGAGHRTDGERGKTGRAKDRAQQMVAGSNQDRGFNSTAASEATRQRSGSSAQTERKQQLADAKSWRRQQLRGDAHQSGAEKRLDAAKDYGRAKMGHAWNTFKQRPIRNSVKGAGVTAAALTAGAASGAMFPVAGMALAGYGATKAGAAAVRNFRPNRAARQDTLLSQYQQHMANSPLGDNPASGPTSRSIPSTPSRPRDDSLHRSLDDQQPPLQPQAAEQPQPHPQQPQPSMPPTAGRVHLDQTGHSRGFTAPRRTEATITTPGGTIVSDRPEHINPLGGGEAKHRKGRQDPT